MKNDAIKSEIARRVVAGTLPEAPRGPVLERFDPKALAVALESELERCRVVGWTRITMHLSLEDATKLARHLRKTSR